MEEYERLYKLYLTQTDEELLAIVNSNDEYTQIAIKAAQHVLDYHRMDYEELLKKHSGSIASAIEQAQIAEQIKEQTDEHLAAKSKTNPVLLIVGIICSLITITVLISALSDLDVFVSPLTNKIYMNNTKAGVTNRNFNFEYMKFFDDNTFQGVHCIRDIKANKYIYDYYNYYGVYNINGNAIEIKMADKSYSGVIRNDGKTITLGGEEFIDQSNEKFSDEFLSQFER